MKQMFLYYILIKQTREGDEERWISKRKFQELEKRIADLEMAVRSQQKEITSLNYPYEGVKQAFAGLSRQK